MKKLRVGLLFGGRSAEHEVSIRSAVNVFKSLNKDKYDVKLIPVTKTGRFHLLTAESMNFPHIDALINLISRMEETEGPLHDPTIFLKNIDVVFPLIHGSFGEDGSLQGMLKQLDIPFVGASVLGSAIGMDKDVSKRLLRDAGIPIGRFIAISNPHEVNFEKVKAELGLPLFVKPANLGSSVGIAKVKNIEEFDTAITNAFTYDCKIMIEEAINGREVECSVLGNEEMKASVVGEIVSTHEFYDYEAKYVDQTASKLYIPAAISEDTMKELQSLSIKVCKVLGIEGMARVDFFLSKENKVYVNEVNTLPGFTDNSMYPKLWEKSGIPSEILVNTLIELALKRYSQVKKLRSDF